MERLDKLLSRELNITRSEAKSLIKQGLVLLDGKTENDPSAKCSEETKITANGKELSQNKFVYIMMNKPKGVISASEGRGEKTVIDLLPKEMRRRGLFPAGRLDKDTTGFVLLTDDGEFAHKILSPKNHIDKEYIAVLDKPFSKEVKRDFENGMELGGKKLLCAELEEVGENTARVILRQGLYHQVKLMFKKHGITVLELKRVSMGALKLDSSLKEGEARYITKAELEKLYND